ELAQMMLELGKHAGREVVCVLTDMDQPLGQAVGNALEIRETIATLRGDGREGRARAVAAVEDGTALASYERWIAAQGGDPAETALPSAPVVTEVRASADGFVRSIGAVDIGMAALRLGAGRQTKDDTIDHAVGILCLKKRGDAVAAGDVLAEVHARDDASAKRAEAEVLAAYELGGEAPPPRSIVLETID